MKRSTLLMALGMGAIVSQAGIGQANAADPITGTEYEIFILDRTGSMATDAGGGNTWWDDAVNQTQAWLAKHGGDSVKRGYAIWTFVDTKNCCGGTQNGLKQIWPILTANGANASTECGSSTKSHFEAADPLTNFSGNATFNYGFCVNDVATGNGALTDTISALLGEKGDAVSLRESNRPALNSGGTNLADSFCSVIEAVRLSRQGQKKIITLQTDAGENDSVGYCSSTNGNTALLASDTSFPKSKEDWNLSADLANPSWQAKTMRRAVRINGSTTQPSSDPTTNATRGAAATATSIKVAEDVPSGATGFVLNVDVHFRICRPSDDPATTGCPATTAFQRIPGLNLPGLGILAATQKEPGGKAIIPSPNLVIPKAALAPLTVNTATGKTLSGATLTTASTSSAPMAFAAAAAAPPAGVPLIDQNEFLFLQNLGKVNSASSFHAIVGDSSVVYGTTHRIAGDVDDSGCTDGADFRIIQQKDVYHQRAVLPLQIAIRADLNRDGWVTKSDAQIVLNNWGRGCINPPGPKPVLK